MRAYELEQTRAQLLSPSQTGERDVHDWISLRAPRDGRVLRIVNDSERIVAAGELLIEIGDPAGTPTTWSPSR